MNPFKEILFLTYAHMSGYVCHIRAWGHFWNGVLFFLFHPSFDCQAMRKTLLWPYSSCVNGNRFSPENHVFLLPVWNSCSLGKQIKSSHYKMYDYRCQYLIILSAPVNRDTVVMIVIRSACIYFCFKRSTTAMLIMNQKSPLQSNICCQKQGSCCCQLCSLPNSCCQSRFLDSEFWLFLCNTE